MIAEDPRERRREGAAAVARASTGWIAAGSGRAIARFDSLSPVVRLLVAVMLSLALWAGIYVAHDWLLEE